MSNSVQVSVVAPCMNEEVILPRFHQRVSAVCEAGGWSYEIVLVNDGSSDRTWEVMKELAANDPHLVLIDLSRNFGHQMALTAGLEASRGEFVMIIDADLQDPPELLNEMMEKVEEGADVVFARRRKREGETLFKLWTAAAFYRTLNYLSPIRIDVDTGDFRMMRRVAVDALLRMPERHRFIRGMVSWLGFRQVEVVYDRAAREQGETKFATWKMISFAMDAITSFSIKPLRMASWAGLIVGFFGLLLLIYAVVGFFAYSTAPGWASTVAIVSVLGGFQLAVLGVIGEYLGRLYEESKRRPLYFVREIVRARDEIVHDG